MASHSLRAAKVAHGVFPDKETSPRLSVTHQLYGEINTSSVLLAHDPPIDNKQPNQSTGGTSGPDPLISDGVAMVSQHGAGVNVKGDGVNMLGLGGIDGVIDGIADTIVVIVCIVV